MTNGKLHSFVDELSKIAAESKLDRKEALQYAALGAASGPAVGALTNTIMHGKPMAKGIPFSRWLPASMLSGAVFGGGIPVIRHQIHEHNVKAGR